MIRGNVLSTNMLRSDYAETDPASGAYIANKPDELIRSAKTLAEAALPRTGGTMTGALNVPEPTEASHAATKDYVERYVLEQVPAMINDALGVIEHGTY